MVERYMARVVGLGLSGVYLGVMVLNALSGI
jgi:hypothetical protein